MKVHKKDFLLKPSLHDVIVDICKESNEKMIEFEVIYPPEPDDIVLCSDIELIRKTIRKLAENAVKFTDTGKIVMGYQVLDHLLEFFVQDTGRGIEKEKLQIVFEMFAQEQTKNTRGYEGSGLGLTITKGLVNLIGGTISVTSEKGKGSTFRFTVPCSGTTSEPKAVLPTADHFINTGKPLILVAEDEISKFRYFEAI